MVNKYDNIQDTTDKIYEFCKDYIFEHGYAPSYDEIGKGVGIKSKGTIHCNMHKLLKEGRIATDLKELASRGFRISGYIIMPIGVDKRGVRQEKRHAYTIFVQDNVVKGEKQITIIIVNIVISINHEQKYDTSIKRKKN